ncbi:hypothetical protein LQ567_22160 [Niabella pedocola]|uniref:G domain-containing protein n=1 Tax=Niabella pedocola TaxID=1752077 RepID=A0ABS8PWR3_9BACT|nr:hypothetical protein [Niabella pedocola]MCD2425505.1 hypothetical protein [Niabella pedocola]
MQKKLFAIVGYTNWGKSNTLYDLFGRRQFFPLKTPISYDRVFGDKKFSVVNASNEDRPTHDYLERLKNVLEIQRNANAYFVITISLIFNDGSHDVKPVFEYLNSLADYDITYLVLKNGWEPGASLKEDDLTRMREVATGRIVDLDTVINKSNANFRERADKIVSIINENR